jgi:hypothetical protein
VSTAALPSSRYDPRKSPTAARTSRSDTSNQRQSGLFVRAGSDLIAALKLADGVESKVILHIAWMAVEADPTCGGFDTWSKPVLESEIAGECYCTKQNINCMARKLFGPKGVLERMDAPAAIKAGLAPKGTHARAFIARLRSDRLPAWIDERRRAIAERDAERERIREEPDEAAPAGEPFRLKRPVRVGPKRKPWRFPAAVLEGVQNSRAIRFSREGVLQNLSFDRKGVLVLDVEAAPAPVSASVSAPPAAPATSPKSPEIGKSICRSPHTATDSKQVTSSGDAALPAASELLRERLDARLMEQIGKPIDDAIYGKVVDALAPVTPERVDALVQHLDSREGRKTTSWPYLLHLIPGVLAREKRAAELHSRRAAAAPAGSTYEAPDVEHEEAEEQAAGERRARIRRIEEQLRSAKKALADAGTWVDGARKARARIEKLEADRDAELK